MGLRLQQGADFGTALIRPVKTADLAAIPGNFEDVRMPDALRDVCQSSLTLTELAINLRFNRVTSPRDRP